MDKEDLIKNIKGWIHLDEEIKDLQRQIKEKRNEKAKIESKGRGGPSSYETHGSTQTKRSN